MTDSAKLETTLTTISKLLNKTAEDIVTIKKAGNLETLTKELTPLEYAKLCSSVGYSLNCLYKSNPYSASLHEAEWNR